MQGFFLYAECVFLSAIRSLHRMCSLWNGVIDFSGTCYHRNFSVLGHTRRRRRARYTHTHTHKHTRARARTHTHTHTHTQHTHNDTMTEMHSLAVFLAKAGYGTVAEMEETLKDMVGVGVVWTWVWLLGVDVQSLGFRV